MRFELFWSYGKDYRVIRVPYWFLVTLTGAVAVVVFSRTDLQFSLRTLLIATTLLAVVLGLGVWLAR